ASAAIKRWTSPSSLPAMAAIGFAPMSTAKMGMTRLPPFSHQTAAASTPAIAPRGLTTLRQVHERRLRLMRLERHGRQPGLDAFADGTGLREVLLRPKAQGAIPEADLPQERYAEVIIGAYRAEE